MPYTKEEHQKASSSIPRNEHGEFSAKPILQETPKETTKNSSVSSFLKNLVSQNTSVEKTGDEDTLIDIHVGNPLHKIIELLKDIKKQKAFSFSIKGTLGIAGVVIVIAGAGIFGGLQSLCNKGIQSHIGTIRILTINEDTTPVDRPLANKIREIFNRPALSTTQTKRTILIKLDYSVIHLVIPASLSLIEFLNIPVIATGNYDSCKQTLTVKDRTGVESLR